MYLDKIGKKDLDDFIQMCKDVGLEFEEEKFRTIIDQSLNYQKTGQEGRNEIRHLQELENYWYKTLEEGSPDYGVYDDVYYFSDLWVCWKVYSRRYVKEIINPKSLINKSIYDHTKNDVKKIADLGCGIGYASSALKEVYGCEVFGTNLEGTKQYSICEKVAKASGIKIRSSLEEVGSADMVFASEYFEHFERPVEHLLDVIRVINPKYILFANTFNSKSIGHFHFYKHKHKKFNGPSISRLFSSKLLKSGYKRNETKCWNNRPAFYEKEY